MIKLDTRAEFELQMLLDALPFYVMLVDAEHKILLANNAIRDDLGLVPEQIIGEYCPKAVHGLEEPYAGCPLCALHEDGLLKDKFEEWKKLVSNGQNVCGGCGRVANSSENLCDPKKL